MKTLKNTCISQILANYSIFKDNLNILPNELQEDIKDQDFNNRYQIINGRVYARSPNCLDNGDWESYKA
jgi:hypothetical protein